MFHHNTKESEIKVLKNCSEDANEAVEAAAVVTKINKNGEMEEDLVVPITE